MADREIVAFNADTAPNALQTPEDPTDRYLAKRPVHLEEALTTDSTIDGRDVAADGTKLDMLTATGAVDLDTLDALLAPLAGRDLSLDTAKLDFVTVTQAVDLDTLETRIAALGVAITLQGSHDASTNLFPTSTLAGEAWIVSVAGMIAGIQFEIGDMLIALIDSASPTIYTANWTHNQYTDLVQSVAGKTGIVTLEEADITDLQSYLLEADIDTLAKLNFIISDATLGDAADFAPAAQGIIAATALQPEDIETLAELNALVTDATLIDTTDSRLSDDRTPATHTHEEVDITDLGSYLTTGDIDTLAELNAIVTDATLIDTTDARLSDARTPVSHTHNHEDVLNPHAVVPSNFSARSATSGIYYLNGFYLFSGTDANLTQAGPTQTFGTANAGHAGHAFFVFGAGATDGINITITVSGTSIDDDGVRTAGDSEVLYTGPVAGLTLDDYLETALKWLGTVTYTLTSDGVNFTCDFNYGFCKYHDYDNHNFYVKWVEFTGLADANDTGFDIEVLHHAATDWTYAASGFVPTDAAICQRSVDYVTEKSIIGGEDFAYKRVNLNQFVEGSAKEGFIIRITTTTNNSVAYLNGQVGLTLDYT